MAATHFASGFEGGEPVPMRVTNTAVRVAIGAGPAAPYAAKPNAGYSGAHALRYASSGAAGRCTLFTPDLLIDMQTTLSWMVLPESVGNDAVASTYVSLDLLLDDGTRVYASAARDRHGVALHGVSRGDIDAE
ncbi:alpha-1,2-mannosidase [Xanthomonas bromi]|uniref:Alpha-1,2-mannosidase n=1 Tax=Xanthomonas bromi TaxID=56449 RepID=A0A1C3NHJ0_9XANT|nr:alpha-1,2-mannosidase [Xanthomonas bromi]